MRCGCWRNKLKVAMLRGYVLVVSEVFFCFGCLYWRLKVGVQVEELKKSIEELKVALQAAKDKQAAAKDECRKLEKDMNEFKNNKEGKIDELKVRPIECPFFTQIPHPKLVQADISKQKSALQKHAVIVKTQQKELQTATLELGTSNFVGVV
jgi:structural maintenance of chromosome 2